METYDAFAARLAWSDGSGDVSTSASPNQPLDENLLATLPETYDAYTSLHRSGLWFDVNPKWHPEFRCFYLRCEPNRDAGGHASYDDDEHDEGEHTGGKPPPSALPRTRTVFVPIASSREGLSHDLLRKLAGLGEQWQKETKSASASEEATQVPVKGTDQTHISVGGTDQEASFRGDPPAKIGTSLAIVDTDGTTVVVRIANGLLEPEDCEKKTQGIFDDDDEKVTLNAQSNAVPSANFSDDDELELDAGDIGVVG
jgi:hypothetical protein|tara:strand:- start:1963 stop:2730 length:768 start_codon:yes stop_codon:yes gene_type:complete